MAAFFMMRSIFFTFVLDIWIVIHYIGQEVSRHFSTILNMATGVGGKIRELRTQKGMQLRKAAAALDVDQSLLCKYERGDRLPNEDFIRRVAKLFSYDEQELAAILLSDKFLAGITDMAVAGKALKIAEQQIKYVFRKT